MKQIYILLIALLMGLSANAEKTGKCGPNLYWQLTDDGVLTITGTGQMEDYNYSYNKNPWHNQNVKQVIIADGVTTIGNYIFFECPKLKSIDIPNSVTTIGYAAFGSCTALTSINLPNSVTTIGNAAFHSCTALTSINVPNSVTTIGNNAFSFCTALTTINIPNSVTTIGNDAFRACTELTSINIPNSVTTIDAFAFSYCSKLKQVDIPNSVTTLCRGLLRDCSSLESIRIHKDLVEIEEGVFDRCFKLTNISCEAITPPTCDTDAFRDINKKKCKLFVPKASIDTYKVANGWKKFSYIEATTGITNNVYNKTELVDVYTIDGTKRLSKASKEEMNALPKGVYIVNGKKIIIKNQ